MNNRRFSFTAMLIFCACIAFSQSSDTTKKQVFFKGALSVTNNGFSFIPSFTLGKPAAIVDISVIGKRFSFEPQFRFNLEDVQPWSFIFIWRYKFVSRNKFYASVGWHMPAINFKLIEVQNNGVNSTQTVTQRFLPFELLATYSISKNTSIGMYYLWGRSLEDGYTPKKGQFLSLRAGFNQINLSKTIYVKFNPQVYYLKQDERDGVFAGSALSLHKNPFPFSISAIVNKVIKTNIVVKDFDWNVSLAYSFSSVLTRK